jgi:aryl-alcohol dehydrogenase-like predicted oxidoreductase
MEQRQVGRSGLRVSRLALGTMTWGRDTDEHEAHDQLVAFAEAGGTLLDTAPAYAEGHSERVVGTLVGKVVPREDVVIATKAGITVRDGNRFVDTSRRALLDALDESLARLRTDHVDLWQVHVWTDETPLDETLSALDHAVVTGRARYVGVSNYNGWQTAKAATWQAAWPGRAHIVATQMEYSLLQRGVEREVLLACADLGIGLLAWSPLGRGVLTGKYRHGTPADSRGASPHFSAFVERYHDAASRRVVDAVATAAEGLGCSPLEVALAWVRDQPAVTAAIVGARTAAQLRGSLSADSVSLPLEIRAALEDISAPAAGYPERRA